MAGELTREQQERVDQIIAEVDTAFRKLVAKGCDAKTLGRALLFLGMKSYPLSRQAPGSPKREIRFYQQDSHEFLLNGMSAKSAKRQVQKALGALDKFRAAMHPLRDAPIWHCVRSPGDCDYICDALGALVRDLEGRIHEMGPQKKPAFEWRVKSTIEYVRNAAKGYHDELLAEVLSAAVPEGYPKFTDGDALRKWRSTHGIVDRSRASKLL